MPFIRNDRQGRNVVRIGRVLAYGAVAVATAAVVLLVAAFLLG